MKLIIGGAFQGKLEYAKKQYQIENWEDGRTCRPEALFSCQGVHHFHEYIRRMIKAGQEVSSLADRLRTENPEIVVVTNELGYGIVPANAFDRNYREAAGRVCTQLAQEAEVVCRVICGIGQVIKG